MRVSHKVTGYNVVLMSQAFGWLELTHGPAITGYIHVSDREDGNKDDRIGNRDGGSGNPPYVVMHQPFSALPTLFHILDRNVDLVISLDEGTGGSAFLKSGVQNDIAPDNDDRQF